GGGAGAGDDVARGHVHRADEGTVEAALGIHPAVVLRVPEGDERLLAGVVVRGVVPDLAEGLVAGDDLLDDVDHGADPRVRDHDPGTGLDPAGGEVVDPLLRDRDRGGGGGALRAAGGVAQAG